MIFNRKKTLIRAFIRLEDERIGEHARLRKFRAMNFCRGPETNTESTENLKGVPF